MASFAHVVNPVTAPPASDLCVAQPITFASLRRARAAAHAAGLAVEQYTTQFAEDATVPGLTRTPDLQRSIYDYETFTVERKLPLVADVVGRLYDASQADYFVYTNPDIALQANFYERAAQLMDGRDAIVINRRTVMATPAQARDLEWLSAQPGAKHPGWDCFLFRRALLAGFDFQRLVLGALPIGQALLAVISTLAGGARFELHEELALTFHINDDQVWHDPRLDPFHAFNFRESWRLLAALEARGLALSPHATRLKHRIVRERPELTRS
jgi:hypothetical protein